MSPSERWFRSVSCKINEEKFRSLHTDVSQIILTDTPIDQSYPKERLVYLSPNADQPLAEVNEEKIHIIGGLVDESVRKVSDAMSLITHPPSLLSVRT